MSVRQVWSVSVGSGSGLGFAPAVVNDAVYAATPDGSVGKFDLQSGRQIWKVRAETKQLSAGVGSDGTTTAVASPDGDVIAFDDTGKVRVEGPRHQRRDDSARGGLRHRRGAQRRLSHPGL